MAKIWGLDLYTESGNFLDRLTLPASKFPVRAEQMAPLIGAFVRVVQDAVDEPQTG